MNTRGMQSGYTHGLTGTFDGQGYTVKGMTFGQFGLFGYTNKATIKDVAFVNATLNGSAYATVLAQWMNETTVSNVYISITNEGTYTKTCSPFAGGVNASLISNCILETKESFAFKSNVKHYGSFTYMNKESMDGDATVTGFSDVYVISNEVLGRYTLSEGMAYLQAQNETLTLAEGETAYTLKGVKKYATAADMQADTENAYTSFNAFWDKTGNTPVWKSVNGAYPSADELVDDRIPDKEIVGDFNVDWL